MRMLKFSRHNIKTGWLETFWIDPEKIKSMVRHEYGQGRFSSLQVLFIGEKEILTLENNIEDKQIAEEIIKKFESYYGSD